MLLKVADKRKSPRAQHLDCNDLLKRDTHRVPCCALCTTNTQLCEKLRTKDIAESNDLHCGA